MIRLISKYWCFVGFMIPVVHYFAIQVFRQVVETPRNAASLFAAVVKTCNALDLRISADDKNITATDRQTAGRRRSSRPLCTIAKLRIAAPCLTTRVSSSSCGPADSWLSERKGVPRSDQPLLLPISCKFILHAESFTCLSLFLSCAD